ncbi:MAG TPA: DUF4190 domain-containing protein [Anaerolineales bacterium]|nr:DUF4190 domain-containing protein [Anaerolineales bacterium]
MLGLVGWAFYLLQWCFDLTIGLLVAAVTAGAGAVCTSVLDVLPFLLWLVGIVTGHVALSQIRHTGASGRGRAVWGLILNYSGLLFIVLFIILIAILISAGIGVGVLDKLLPMLKQH